MQSREQLSDQSRRILPPNQPQSSQTNDRITTGVQRSIVAGFFMHIARRDSHDGCYRTIVDRTEVYIHPSSSLYGRPLEMDLIGWCIMSWSVQHVNGCEK